MRLTDIVEHRPYPLPEGSWAMRQTWSKLLFMHWPLPADVVRPYIPNELKLDTFDGNAWISVVPFLMSNVYPRFTFPLPWLSAFPELNVRTYVTHEDKPGVWFFSLDAANPVAVMIARTFYHLPYFNATMSVVERTHSIDYYCMRRDRRSEPAQFVGEYGPSGDIYVAQPDTLEYFLVERYCLYAQDKKGNLYRGDIHHQPWPL
ncbi:MAG: hypothetical protein CUN55_03500, partial [Phototrophicales bacterium]